MQTTETVKTAEAPKVAEAGFPSAMMAKIMRADARVSFDGMNRDGDVKMSAPMAALGLTGARLSRTPLAGTAFFVDLLGEVLVRKNIGVFARLLEELRDYDRVVNFHRHRHFGMVIDGAGVLRFQFHISLVQHILTEDLAGLFTY